MPDGVWGGAPTGYVGFYNCKGLSFSFFFFYNSNIENNYKQCTQYYAGKANCDKYSRY